MKSLKEKLKEILGYFDATKRVVYYDYPIHLNVGDLLIERGTEKFFADNHIHVWKRYSIHDMPASIRGMDDDVVIVCHGGGNFGDLYPIFQKSRERVLQLYPRNPIVVLPQTLHFDSQDRLTRSLERFRKHRNCHIFARDSRSLEILQQAGIRRSSAMPDMAHCLWGSLVADESPDYETQPMRFERRDTESKPIAALGGDEWVAQPCDWPDIVSHMTYRCCRMAYYAIRMQSLLGFNTQKFWQWRPFQDMAIRDGVRFFSRHQEIYTNRLHAMLLGLLLKRKVYAFDNSYGKLSYLLVHNSGAGHQPLFYLDGPVVDQHHVRNGLTPIFARRTQASMLMGAAQQSEDASTQLAARHGVQGGVDGFVREPHRFIHRPQCERNLLWTQALAQACDDGKEERAAHHQLTRHAGFDGQSDGPLMGCRSAIAARDPRTPAQGNFRLRLPAVACHLASDGRARRLAAGGFRRRTPTQPQLRLKQCSFH
jgi:pyruvyl transferase EpsO